MRKLAIVLLLLVLLCGCTEQPDPETGTEFWYMRSSYQYGTEACMFAGEYVDTKVTDLASALSVYLQGPTDPALQNPFPANTALISYAENDGVASITLSDAFAQASPAAIHCAAICLTKTVIANSVCQTVCIYLESTPDDLYLQLTEADFAMYDDVITDVVTTPENEVAP